MITMFRKIRRPLLGLAVIASSIAVVPIAASVVNASAVPAKPIAVAGDSKASVAVSPVGGTGTVTYTVTTVEDNTKTCSFTSAESVKYCVVTGLTNGTAYTFTATAGDSSGTSNSSVSSDPVTPALAAPAFETFVERDPGLSMSTEGRATFIDSAGDYVYVGTDETSGTDSEVLKFRLSDMTLADSEVVTGTYNSFNGATTDGTFGYFSSPYMVHKVRLSDLTVMGSVVVEGYQLEGRNMAVINGFLYRVAQQGWVEKINTSTMTVTARFQITNDPSLIAAFEGGGNLFAIQYFVNGGSIKVFKINVAAANFDNSAVSSISLSTASTGLSANMSQGYNGVASSTHAYVLANAGYGTAARVLKIDLTSLGFIGAVELTSTETRPTDIAIDTTLNRLYVVGGGVGKVSRINLNGFSQMAGPLDATYGEYGSPYGLDAVVAKPGSSQFWGVGTPNNLRLVRFGLGGPIIGTPSVVGSLQASSSTPGQMTVSWTAPSTTGGFPVIGYRVTASSSYSGTYAALSGCEAALTSTNLSCTGTGLGGSYYVKVVAINAVGDGTAPFNPAQSYVTPLQVSVTPSSVTISGTVGTAITPSSALTFNNFSSTPTVTTPSPLNGLTLNPQTGVISGTPTSSSVTNALLLVSNGSQSASVTVNFNISGGGTGGNPVSGGGGCTSGVTVTPSTTTGTGMVGNLLALSGPTPIGFSGTPTFTVSGVPLPNGLTLNPQTGAVAGTPTASSYATVIINVVSGSQSCQYSIMFAISSGGGGMGGGTPCVAGAPSSTNSAVTFDSAFAGDGGYDFSGQLSSSTFGDAAAGPDGSLYVAVSDGSANINSPTNSSTRVVRFPANGTPSTWGSASVDVNSSTDYSESVKRLLVLSDGSAVVMIKGMDSGPSSNFTSDYKLAKFTSAGVLDTTFGTNGLATIVSGASEMVSFGALAEGPAGSIYVSKSTRTGSGPSSSMTYAIIKFGASGSIDSAFGSGGELTVTSQVMAADSTGALFVGGRTSSSPANAKIVKYTTSGVIDTTFGVAGSVEIDASAASSSESVGGLAFANGKISGTVYLSSYAENTMSFATSAFRMSTAGVLDTSFDSDGIASVGTLGGPPREITVLPDGGLILPFAVYANQSNTLGLVGVLANGTPVTSLVTSPAKISSGTCVLGTGSIFATSAGIFAAGTSGNMTIASHVFKISIAGMAAGAASGTPAPTFVTSANAAALVRAPGSESIIINGEEVVIESKTVSIPASRTPASQRTPAQVASIQQAGAALLQQFLASLPAGATTNVTVVNTATGAVMRNLVFDANGNAIDVPVEDIVFLDGPQLSLMIGSNNANITADGKYQVGAGGIVGVTGSGLGASADGEIVAMSTPTLLANFQTSAAGDFTKSATLPESIGVGDHTLVVATGSTYAMMGIRVVPAALPTTGSSSDRVVIIALFTLVFGALFFRGRRISLI